MSFEKACRYGRVWVVLVWCGVCGEHAHPTMRGGGVKIYGFLNYFFADFHQNRFTQDSSIKGT